MRARSLKLLKLYKYDLLQYFFKLNVEIGSTFFAFRMLDVMGAEAEGASSVNLTHLLYTKQNFMFF